MLDRFPEVVIVEPVFVLQEFASDGWPEAKSLHWFPPSEHFYLHLVMAVALGEHIACCPVRIEFVMSVYLPDVAGGCVFREQEAYAVNHSG